MRLVWSPVCARLIDAWGERVVMATGICIVAVSSGLAGISQSYFQLLLLHEIGGIGSAMFTVSTFTLLLTSVEAGLRGEQRILPGWVPDRGDDRAGGGRAVGDDLDHRTVLLLRRNSGRGRTVGLVMLHSRPGRPEDQSTEPILPFRAVLRDTRYQAACFTNLAQGWTAFGVRTSLIPVLVVEVLAAPAWTGIAFACAAVAQTVAVGPAGKFTDTVGRRPAMIAGGAIAVSRFCWCRSSRTSGC